MFPTLAAIGLPTTLTPPHNFICLRQDGVGEKIREKRKKKDPSQETKRKRNKDHKSPKKRY
jgi:hypothetical protein